MESRMKSPVFILPGTREALLGIVKAVENAGVPRVILELVNVRVGQINGCSFCVDMHTRALRRLGESDRRLFTLAVWRETPYFTDAERAALALAEAATRLADATDAVPDSVWSDAARHFPESELSALLMTIAVANLWNRLNVATRRVTGDFVEQFL
jgi:AhpD family alkylhydroperoxidase